MRTAGNMLLLLAVGSWGGSLLFYSFVVTPTLFAVLGREAGGRAVNSLFPNYFAVLFGLALLTAVAAALLGLLTTAPSWPVWATAGVALAAAGAGAYSRWILLPQIAQAERGTPAFDQLHQFSLVLNFISLACFLVCVFLIARYPGALLGAGPQPQAMGTAAEPAAAMRASGGDR